VTNRPLAAHYKVYDRPVRFIGIYAAVSTGGPARLFYRDVTQGALVGGEVRAIAAVV
jgi:hypothetical protein